MKFKAFIVTVFLAFPVFIRLSSIGFHNFKTVIGISLFIFGIFVIINKRKRQILNYKDSLLQFNIFFTILVFLQWLSHGNINTTLGNFVTQIFPFVSSIIIISFIENYDSKYQKQLLIKIIYGMGIIFLLQFTLSFYESLTNTFLINYGLLDRRTSLELLKLTHERSLLSLIGINIGTKFPLTMLLGQWNFSVPLFAIYNLAFLFAYFHTKKYFFKLLLIIILIAAVLNTTRAGILTIIITDIISYLFIDNKSEKKKHFKKIILIFAILIFIFQTSLIMVSYFNKTNTLSIRFEIYNASFSYMLNNYLDLIWGVSYLGIAKLQNSLQSIGGLIGFSFESEFLSVIFFNGFIGLFLFLRFLKQIYFNNLSSKSKKIFLKLLSLNIILTSLTLNGIFLIFIYPIMTCAYLYIKNTDM